MALFVSQVMPTRPYGAGTASDVIIRTATDQQVWRVRLLNEHQAGRQQPARSAAAIAGESEPCEQSEQVDPHHLQRD